MNADSSRSHLVFAIIVKGRNMTTQKEFVGKVGALALTPGTVRRDGAVMYSKMA